jgi:hypothetical protein
MQLVRLCREHPSEGYPDELGRIIGAMARTPESADQSLPKKNPGALGLWVGNRLPKLV